MFNAPNIYAMYKDPEIKVVDALALYGGNQSRLADALNLQRSSVCLWVSEGRENIPPLQAYRLTQIHPQLSKTAA